MLQSDFSETEYYNCFHTDLQNIPSFLLAPSRQVVLFVEKGSALVSVNEKKYRARENVMLFIQPDSEIKLINHTKDFKVFFVSFLRSIMHEVGQRLEPRFFGLLFHKIHWFIIPEARDSVRGFCSMFEYAYNDKRNPFRHDVITSLIEVFIKGIYGVVMEYYPDLKSNDTLRIQTLFKRFMFLLENNYTTEHGVQFYAEQLCISTKYLTQICRRVVQKTPKSLIDYKLFSVALGMLDRTDKTIQEVSNALGFPDQSYFSRFFKRCMGVSPVYYRQNPGKVHLPAFEEF